MNEGTARLYADYAPERLTEEVRAKALASANSLAANAKKAAYRRGKPLHPNARRALSRFWGKPPTSETRRKMSEPHRRRGTRPPKAGRPWTTVENSLLGTMPDEEVARLTRRTLCAVQCQRAALDIDGWYRKR